MPDNPEDPAVRTMTTEPSTTPIALTASKVNFTNNPPGQQIWIISVDDFPDEFMPRRARKAVVATLELKICVADPTDQQPDQSEAGRSGWASDTTYMYTPIFKV